MVRQELLSLTFIYELNYPEEKKNSYYLNQKWKNERINKIKENERKHNEIWVLNLNYHDGNPLEVKAGKPN